LDEQRAEQRAKNSSIDGQRRKPPPEMAPSDHSHVVLAKQTQNPDTDDHLASAFPLRRQAYADWRREK
jgi:hypothetical protein